MRPVHQSAIASSRNSACLIRSQLTARIFGSNSIQVDSVADELMSPCACETLGPRRMNWPLLLRTVSVGPVGAAPNPSNATNNPAMTAMVLTFCSQSPPQVRPADPGGNAESSALTADHLPSGFGEEDCGSAFDPDFVSGLGAAGLPSPAAAGAAEESFRAASL